MFFKSENGFYICIGFGMIFESRDIEVFFIG
jgi:hypothetical protein